MHRWVHPGGSRLERDAGYDVARWNGTELRRRRELRNVTLSELGADAGFSASTIAGWERGPRCPPPEFVAMLAHAWGTTMRAFFTRPASETSPPHVDARSSPE